MAVVFLVLAIISEVTATLSLKAAVKRKKWIIGVVTGYFIAYSALTLSLRAGMPLGVAYGVWAAAGVAITAIAGRVLFKEPFDFLMSCGVVLIVGGVLLVDLGVVHA